MAAGIVEINDKLQLGRVNLGDGSVHIICQGNLQDMVRAIAAQTPMNSIDVLRITSPRIIGILIGLLLPAVNKVREAAAPPGLGKLLPAVSKAREAAAHSLSSLNLKLSTPGSQKGEGEILPYMEKSLGQLRPYFAHGAHVELRMAHVAAGDVNGDGLIYLAKVLGVPVLTGGIIGDGSWSGPVTKATPQGGLGRA